MAHLGVITTTAFDSREITSQKTAKDTSISTTLFDSREEICSYKFEDNLSTMINHENDVSMLVNGIDGYSKNPVKTISGVFNNNSDIIVWKVLAISTIGGDVLGSTITSLNSFSIELSRVTPVIILTFPDIQYEWGINKSYAVGDIVISKDTVSNPYILKCKTSGVSGVTEPIWNTSGDSLDNSVVWEYISNLVKPDIQGPISVPKA